MLKYIFADARKPKRSKFRMELARNRPRADAVLNKQYYTRIYYSLEFTSISKHFGGGLSAAKCSSECTTQTLEVSRSATTTARGSPDYCRDEDR